MPEFFVMPNYRKSILRSLKNLKIQSEEERLQNEDSDEEIDDKDYAIKLEEELSEETEAKTEKLDKESSNNTEEIANDLKSSEDDGDDETNTESDMNDIDIDEMLAFAEKNIEIPIKCIFCETCEATPSLLEEHYQIKHSKMIESYQSSEDEQYLGDIYSCTLAEWFNTRVDATVVGPIDVNIEDGNFLPTENNPPNQVELLGNETDDENVEEDDALEDFPKSTTKLTGKYLKRKHTNPEMNVNGEVRESLEREKIITENENREVTPCKTSKSKENSEE